MRVLHAPIVALYQPWLYVEGLRKAGCEADYMCHYVQEIDKWLMHSYDFDLQLGLNSAHFKIKIEKEMDFFLYAIANYDVFHFHSGYGLFRGDSKLLPGRCCDLAYLKKLGKKTVMHWWGCDLRTFDIDSNNKYSACHECEDSIKKYCLTKDKNIYKLIERFSDVQTSVGDLCASFSNIKWFNNAIDTDYWRPMEIHEIPERYRLKPTQNIRIYHSFGHSKIRGDVKGTKEIVAAVKRLRGEGYPVEFIFFDGVTQKDLRYYQTQADIVIDQLRAGWHGSTAVECMACGKPVITYIRPEVAEIAPPGHPLINANLENIYDVLKDLVLDAGKREEIGKMSRAYALREHSHKVLGARLLEMYKNI